MFCKKANKAMQLIWHRYKYYPYERELALREIQTLLRPTAVRTDAEQIYVDQPERLDAIDRLVYFPAALAIKRARCVLSKACSNGSTVVME